MEQGIRTYGLCMDIKVQILYIKKIQLVSTKDAAKYLTGHPVLSKTSTTYLAPCQGDLKI